ncbi:hypothetical protein PYCC9005_003355 [Savitreella phatthalungensis]
MVSDTITGYVVTDIKNWQKFEKQQFPSKKLGAYDVTVAIDTCSICASDLHTITGGWSSEVPVPLCVGHEIVGKAIEVGSKVDEFKVGDRVGVGAQIAACLGNNPDNKKCPGCSSGFETSCPILCVDTYGANYPDKSWPHAEELAWNGEKTMGGFSNMIRTHQQFVFKIPDNLSDTQAAPIMCAGITSTSPMREALLDLRKLRGEPWDVEKNGIEGVGKGFVVAVAGMGGLGHYVVQFAKALGAETHVLSHTADKEKDAKELGADYFHDTSKKGWEKELELKFDFLLSTIDNAKAIDLETYATTLTVGATWHTVGLPDDGITVTAQALAGKSIKIAASHLGPKTSMNELLRLASEGKIKSIVEEIPASEEALGDAVRRVYENDNVRYRLVITGLQKALGEVTA